MPYVFSQNLQELLVRYFSRRIYPIMSIGNKAFLTVLADPEHSSQYIPQQAWNECCSVQMHLQNVAPHSHAHPHPENIAEVDPPSSHPYPCQAMWR